MSTPYGYTMTDNKWMIVDAEAAKINWLFKTYLALGSIEAVVAACAAKDAK
jgi:hypothetical protein